MIRVKDLCRWYKMSYGTMRKCLVRCGVIPETDKGRGNRKGYSATRLKPLFAEYGTPKELTLMLDF